MKKFIAMLLAIVMVLSMTACGTKTEEAAPAQEAAPAEEAAPVEEAAPAAEPIVLKIGHANAIDTPVDVSVNMFADKVAEYSDGRITVEIYPASQLGSLQEMQDALEMGTLDMTCAEINMLSTIRPELAILSLPMLVTSYDMAYAAFDLPEVADLVEQMAEENNVRQLCWWFQGYRHLITKNPITSLADCKGVKLRSPEAENYINTSTTLGFNPVAIPW